MNTFEMELKNGAMIFTSQSGETFKFDSVNCSTLT